MTAKITFRITDSQVPGMALSEGLKHLLADHGYSGQGSVWSNRQTTPIEAAKAGAELWELLSANVGERENVLHSFTFDLG
jgi:hypothetical protein